MFLFERILNLNQMLAQQNNDVLELCLALIEKVGVNELPLLHESVKTRIEANKAIIEFAVRHKEIYANRNRI